MNAPLTQNTAPIIEHRCLYTHDLRRKAKRWQDGVLRFHTFNKRVMVYDVQRNFIGDTHWREPGPIQDGDELQLERPVLVQVCDQIGRTEQNLTELLERKKKKGAVTDGGMGPQSSPILSSPHASMASTKILPSPLQPKSLNALLGKSGGRLGRAKLPTKSPYEVRQDNIKVVQTIDRPSKRQRLQPPQLEHNLSRSFKHHTNNDIEPIQEWSRRPSPILLDSSESQNPVTGATSIPPIPNNVHKRSQGAKYQQQTNIRAKSLAVPPKKQREHIRAKTTVVQPDVNLSQEKLSLHTPDPARRQGTRKTASPSRDATADRSYLARSPRMAESLGRSSSTSENLTNRSDVPLKPKSRLQIVPRKPRRKLMYRDLLPQDASHRSTERTDHAPVEGGGTVGTASMAKSLRSTRSASLNGHGVPCCRSPADGDVEISTENVEEHYVISLDSENEASKDNELHSDTPRRTINTQTESRDPISLNVKESVQRASNLPTNDSHFSLDQLDEILIRPRPKREASPTSKKPHQGDGDSTYKSTLTGISDFIDLNHTTSPPSNPGLQASPQNSQSRPTSDFNENGKQEVRPQSEADGHADSYPPVQSPEEKYPIQEDIQFRAQTASTRSPPSLHNSTSLPDFMPPRITRKARSPLKPSISEGSINTKAPANFAKNPVIRKCAASVVDPWSHEAWDLFGCSKGGKGVDYGEYCRS